MEPAGTILIIEDYRPTRKFLAGNLIADGYEVLEAESAGEALHLIETRFPDLALVDLGLPDRDGLELMRQVRDSDRATSHLDPELPMLALTGRTTELDRIRGFERGADDYVLKPFSYAELRARIAALLRRTARRPRAGRTRIGPLEIEPLARMVWLDGQVVQLSKKEFALLRALASEPTRVYTRDELLRGVWGFRAIGSTRTLDSHASRLRKKLNATGAQFVVNVWGVGYRLVEGELA